MSSDRSRNGVNHPTNRECPACGNDEFNVRQYPADTLGVFCADCGTRCLLADLRDSGLDPEHAIKVDSRWYDAA